MTINIVVSTPSHTFKLSCCHVYSASAITNSAAEDPSVI